MGATHCRVMLETKKSCGSGEATPQKQKISQVNLQGGNCRIYFFLGQQGALKQKPPLGTKKKILGKINASLHSRRDEAQQTSDFTITKKPISGSQKLGTKLALDQIRDHRSNTKIRSAISYIRSFCFSSSPSGEAGRLGKKTKRWSRLGGSLALAPLADPFVFVFGETLVGRGSAPPNLAGENIPPRPTIRRATIPAPIVLTSDDTEETQVLRLAQAYRGALFAKYKVRSWAFSKGKPSSWKLFPLLLGAASVMVQKSLAPAPWAYWSLGVWGKINEKSPTGVPCAPATFVFGKSRLAGHTGQFRKEGMLGAVGRVWLGPAQIRLIERYEGLVWEAIRAPAQLVPELVSKFFPGTLLQDMTSMAQCEADKYSEILSTRLDRGDWLW